MGPNCRKTILQRVTVSDSFGFAVHKCLAKTRLTHTKQDMNHALWRGSKSVYRSNVLYQKWRSISNTENSFLLNQLIICSPFPLNCFSIIFENKLQYSSGCKIILNSPSRFPWEGSNHVIPVVEIPWYPKVWKTSKRVVFSPENTEPSTVPSSFLGSLQWKGDVAQHAQEWIP